MTAFRITQKTGLWACSMGLSQLPIELETSTRCGWHHSLGRDILNYVNGERGPSGSVCRLCE